MRNKSVGVGVANTNSIAEDVTKSIIMVMVMSEKRFKDEKSCSNCRNQMTGFDGGFFGLPFTCECRIYGETENRKNCSKFEKKITKSYLLDKIKELEKENVQLKQKLENIGLNEKNDMIKMVDGKVFIKM